MLHRERPNQLPGYEAIRGFRGLPTEQPGSCFFFAPIPQLSCAEMQCHDLEQQLLDASIFGLNAPHVRMNSVKQFTGADFHIRVPFPER